MQGRIEVRAIRTLSVDEFVSTRGEVAEGCNEGVFWRDLLRRRDLLGVEVWLILLL